MKHIFNYFLILPLIGCLFTSCASVQQRKNVQISRAAFAINDAINKGRFDTAKNYSKQLDKLVAPIADKNKVKVTTFHIDSGVDAGKTLTVLPSGTDSTSIVIEDSQQYKDLLDGNKVLQKQLSDEHDKLISFQGQTNKILVDQAAELQKEQSKGNIFKRFFNWLKIVTGFGLLGTIVVLVIILLFAPELLPIIFNMLSILWTLLKDVINLILTGFNNLLTEIKNYKKT